MIGSLANARWNLTKPSLSYQVHDILINQHMLGLTKRVKARRQSVGNHRFSRRRVAQRHKDLTDITMLKGAENITTS